MEKFDYARVAEVKLHYKTKVKAADRPKVSCSNDAYIIFKNSWDESMEHHETMKLLLLNRANRVLGIVNLSSGGTSGCVVDIKIVFQYAIKASASSIILCHNHPSGNLMASNEDKKITERIKQASSILDIKLLDHLIVTPYDGYLSMVDEGLI